MFDVDEFKKYIDENGVKQRFIAQQANISDAVLSAIVTGRSKCTLENYVLICKALCVPLGTFISDDAQPAA